MTHITFLNIVAFLAGMGFTFLSRLQSAMQRKSKMPLSRGKWVSENWIDTLLGAVASFCAVFFMDELSSMVGFAVEQGTGEAFYSFMCGLNGQFLVSKVKGLIKK